jgi:ubiquinone biosynthesis protein COQ9
MSDPDFDTALVTAAFRIAADQGWRNVNVVGASRAAGLPVDEARARFLNRSSILLRFGRLADQAALKDAPSEGPIRDRLFDLLLRRFDALQAHRSGVKALLRALPTEPPTALLLACATRTSMRWMLQAAGVTASGPRGALQVRGLVAVWLWGVRAWQRDESDDLSATMAAVDAALGRADRVAPWLSGSVRSAPPPPPAAPGAGEIDPSDPPAPSGSGPTPNNLPPLSAPSSPSTPTDPPEAATEA